MAAVIGENTVYVGATAYPPGSEVPKDVAAELGAHCFEGGKHPYSKTAGKAGDSSSNGGGSDGPPPKAGAGSGTDAWLAYARTFDDVQVADDAKRDEIIAALTTAGHPVE